MGLPYLVFALEAGLLRLNLACALESWPVSNKDWYRPLASCQIGMNWGSRHDQLVRLIWLGQRVMLQTKRSSAGDKSTASLLCLLPLAHL